MPLITAITAKQHLRVDSTAEDDLITIWIGVAEQQASEFLNRNVYPDQGSLDAAVAAAPAALAAATAAYDAAILDADAMDEGVDRSAAGKYAEESYAIAQTTSDRAQRGMVVNESVKAALLLIIGNLYEHRGDAASGEIPAGARALLQPYRVAMGV